MTRNQWAKWPLAKCQVHTKIEYSLYVRRYAPFASFGGGFEGDARGFSTSLTATSRTVGVATFGPCMGSEIGATAYSTGSSWVGPWEVRKKYSLGSIGAHKAQVAVSILNVVVSEGTVSFTLYTEGNLPFKDIALHRTLAKAVDWANHALRPNSRNLQGTPDIDTFVDFAVVFSDNKLIFDGAVRGDGFPNAEVFVLDAASQAVALVDYRTRSGVSGPFHRLWGPHAHCKFAFFHREVDLKHDGTFGTGAGRPPAVFQEPQE
jgi:hypothetical protein